MTNQFSFKNEKVTLLLWLIISFFRRFLFKNSFKMVVILAGDRKETENICRQISYIKAYSDKLVIFQTDKMSEIVDKT